MRQFVDLLDRIERLDFLGSESSMGGAAGIEDEHFNTLKDIPVDGTWVPNDSTQETYTIKLVTSYIEKIRNTLFSGIEIYTQKRIRDKHGMFSFIFKGVGYYIGWDRTCWKSECHCIHLEGRLVVRFDSLRELVGFICTARKEENLRSRLKEYWKKPIDGENEFNGGYGFKVSGPIDVDRFDDDTLFHTLKKIPVDSEWLPHDRAAEGVSVEKLRGYLQSVSDCLFDGQNVQVELNDRQIDKYYLLVSQGIGYYIGWNRCGFSLKCYMTDYDDPDAEIVALKSLRGLVSILCTAQDRVDLGARLDRHWEGNAVEFAGGASP